MKIKREAKGVVTELAGEFIDVAAKEFLSSTLGSSQVDQKPPNSFEVATAFLPSPSKK